MTQKARLVAFTGPAGSGKSTAAAALEEAGFTRVRFAGPLKAMMTAFYTNCALDPWEIDARIEGERKQTPDPLLGGKTPREAMQTLGTEWGRDTLWPDLWVNAWRERVQRLLDMGISVVCEDCRFPNEAETIRALGGVVVGVYGRGGIGTEHASERFDFKPDAELWNMGFGVGEFRQRALDTFGPDGGFWPALEPVEDESPIDNDYEELALRVLSCGQDVEQAAEIIRSAMEDAHDLWATPPVLFDPDYFTESELRTLDGMLSELAEATGLPKAHTVGVTHRSPYHTEQTVHEIDVRPGITSEELREVIAAWLMTDAESRRLAQFTQMRNHIGSFFVEYYNQAERTRLAFYIDAWEAGVEMSLNQLDEILGGVIGGEQ